MHPASVRDRSCYSALRKARFFAAMGSEQDLSELPHSRARVLPHNVALYIE